MDLHNKSEKFLEIIEEIKKEKQYKPAIIEKDYYVTLFLKTLVKNLPNLIFRGGTSLSKCHKVINRFSEDIDISVEFTNKLSQGAHKKVKAAIVKTVDELGMKILNIQDTRSRRDFNKYKIDYDSVYKLPELKQYLFVETYVALPSFPCETKAVTSIVQDFLEEKGFGGTAKEFGLTAFDIRVQSLDRTLIDKIFALGDYYLENKEEGHSRHIYDIYKISPLVKIDNDFKNLFLKVRELRKQSQYCYSAQTDVDLQKILRDIVDKDIYKKDFEGKTKQLLFEEVEYKDIRAALKSLFETLFG